MIVRWSANHKYQQIQELPLAQNRKSDHRIGKKNKQKQNKKGLEYADKCGGIKLSNEIRTLHLLIFVNGNATIYLHRLSSTKKNTITKINMDSSIALQSRVFFL